MNLFPPTGELARSLARSRGALARSARAGRAQRTILKSGCPLLRAVLWRSKQKNKGDYSTECNCQEKPCMLKSGCPLLRAPVYDILHKKSCNNFADCNCQPKPWILKSGCPLLRALVLEFLQQAEAAPPGTLKDNQNHAFSKVDVHYSARAIE